MSYSLWLVPNEEEVKKYLAQIVKELADNYGGPVFEPHATLLGDLPLSLDEVIKGCEYFVSKTNSFKAEISSVEYSTTYYQCIFVRLKPTPELMNLYDLAKQSFGLTKPSIFMPHVSLFYGDIPYHQRQKIVDSIQLLPQQFTVASVIVVPGGENPPSEWKHLTEFKFL